MPLDVRVLGLDPNIEEEVLVEIMGRRVTCFATVCPYAVALGETYPGTLHLFAVDGIEVREATDEPEGVFRLGGFRHRVVGTIRGASLDAGLRFEDDLFASEYAYLDGHKVVVEVDRIDLAFE